MDRQKSEKTILFAIPSYNEADSIGTLTKVIDRGLVQFFPKYRAIIVNADNDSPDGTKKAFLSTPTKSEKIYLSSRGKSRKLRGKGFHMRMVFEYAIKINADAIGFIDGDVKSATPQWIDRLIRPVLQGYDHVLPIYLRNEYDGAITNHLVFPVLRGLLGIDIRQPLGGEIGLSKRAIHNFLSRKWYLAAYWYGVDIFMVTQSIFSNLRIAQTMLGVKSHKPSAPKLNPMFLQVAESLFLQLKSHRKYWRRKKIIFKAPPILKRSPDNLHVPELAFDYKQSKEATLREYYLHRKEIARLTRPMTKEIDAMFRENHGFRMTPDLWARIVYHIAARGKTLSPQELLAFRTLFFSRFLTFYKDVMDETHHESEKRIVMQAKLFRSLRKCAIT